MRVLVYGGGAVGLGIASCLMSSGESVDIIARPDTTEKLRTQGLIRTGIFGLVRLPAESFGAFVSLDELGSGPYDFALVCTKSFDSPAAAKDLAAHSDLIGSDTMFVLCQNGWGNAEVFAPLLGAERIFNARVITGFSRRQLNEVEVTVHADAIHVGSLFSGGVGRVEPLCRSIRDGGIPCETTDAIGKDLWAKMLYNCALNPLGAILKVPYGALAEQTTSRELMNRIIEEVFAVMVASGYQTHWQNAEEFIAIFYDKLVPDTAGHRSSMLQDLSAGKRTEIDALNGAVLTLAGEHGLATPYNRAVYDLLKFVESGRR